jgi:hypothetical protein
MRLAELRALVEAHEYVVDSRLVAEAVLRRPGVRALILPPSR